MIVTVSGVQVLPSPSGGLQDYQVADCDCVGVGCMLQQDSDSVSLLTHGECLPGHLMLVAATSFVLARTFQAWWWVTVVTSAAT
jgi:hypothetical protein